MTTEVTRLSTGMAALDHVLGGGLAVASVVLLAGPPGIGRSTLSLQMLAGLGHRCLYASGEETREHLEGLARRIGALTPHLSVLSERNLATIFTHAREVRAQTIVIDTIQTISCEDVNGRHGSPTQVKECVSRLVRYAKTNDTTIWIVGHITSDGDIAGPKAIEHDVDVVLRLSRESKFDGAARILKCPHKNRFGPTNAVGSFELTVEGLVPVNADEGRIFDASLIPRTGPASDAEIAALRSLASHVASWANSDEVDTLLPYRNQGDVLDTLLALSKVYAPGTKP